MIEVLACYGTRPEGIKMHPILWASEKSASVRVRMLAVGQHTDLLRQLDHVFGTSPDHRVPIAREAAGLNGLLASTLRALDPFLTGQSRPDVLLVQGDTSTALAAAIAAHNLHVPVVHLEAGLRSGDLSNPHPEEGNRKMISAVSSLHLAPTKHAARTLYEESIAFDAVRVVGNTVVDSANWALRQPFALTGRIGDLVASGSDYIVVTLHRRESWGATFDGLLAALRNVVRLRPEMNLVFCMHANPDLQALISSVLGNFSNVLLSGPMGYVDFMHLMAKSCFIVSDSGGVQEEAPTFQRRVLLLRDVTERPEAVTSGHVVIAGRDPDRIREAMLRWIDQPEDRYIDAANPFGDGHAGVKSVSAIEEVFG